MCRPGTEKTEPALAAADGHPYSKRIPLPRHCRCSHLLRDIVHCREEKSSAIDRPAGLFLRGLCDYRRQRRFRLHEFVVMPDHFHLLLTVELDDDVHQQIQQLLDIFPGEFAPRCTLFD